MAEYTGGGGGGQIDPHSSTHEAGGSDEVSVATSLLVDDSVTAAKIAAGAVGNTQVANGDSFNWTDVHQWSRTEPSSGTNTWKSLVNSTSGDTWSWQLKSNGLLGLFAGTTEILELDAIGDARPQNDWFFQASVGVRGDLRVDGVVEHGPNAEIVERYSSGNDGWELIDGTNIRMRMDRTTGDLFTDGTITEGATL